MTRTTPQVGDTIATAEELDALPVGAAFLAAGHVWLWRGRGERSAEMQSLTGGAWTYSEEALRICGAFTLLYLPGHTPRPEREVKAEALREAADTLTPSGEEPLLVALLKINGGARAAFEYGVAALREMADRIARGDA